MIGYLVYKLSGIISLVFPVNFSYKFAKVIAYIYYLLAVRIRRDVLYNLNCAFKDRYSSYEINVIRINIFKNFAKGIVDFCRLSKIDKLFISKYVNIKNLNYVDEVLKTSGVVLLSGHIGSWELGGVVLSVLGYPINVVAKPHIRKKVERFFIKQRSNKGVNVIPLGGSYRQCYKKLVSKELVGLVSDRKYTRGEGIKVKCFDNTIQIPKGAAVLGLRTNSPIISCYMVRRNNGYFDFVFEKPIFPEDIKGGSYEERLNNIAQKYIDIMQKYIEKYPDQWLVFNRLFVE